MNIPGLLKRQAAAPTRPDLEWVGRTYGGRAHSLVVALPGLMEAASLEARLPSGPRSPDVRERSQAARQLLWDDLRDLRAAVIGVDVPDDGLARDRRLRASVAAAIGAASSLASASPSQPTLGYLGLTRAAVDAVLEAAGHPPLEQAGHRAR